MLMRRIIPCLDVDGGRVVKGVKFQGLRDAGSAVELAQVYQDQGADELVLLDVSATPAGRAHNLSVVKEIRLRLSIPFTVGGGIRKVEDAQAVLEAGADKVGVNTAAVERPELIGELAQRFGRQCVVLAVDAALRNAEQPQLGWEIVTRSGKHRVGTDAIEWVRQAMQLGAGEILLTSWDKDGTRSGYDLELIRAIGKAVHVPIIASGGAAHADHLLAALNAGADAVLAASIFHDGDFTVGQLKDLLSAKGQLIRMSTSSTEARQ